MSTLRLPILYPYSGRTISLIAIDLALSSFDGPDAQLTNRHNIQHIAVIDVMTRFIYNSCFWFSLFVDVLCKCKHNFE